MLIKFRTNKLLQPATNQAISLSYQFNSTKYLLSIGEIQPIFSCFSIANLHVGYKNCFQQQRPNANSWFFIIGKLLKSIILGIQSIFKQFIKFNCKMNIPSQAYTRAKAAFQQQFPSKNLPNYTKGQSIFTLIHTITSQNGPPLNHALAIQHMKAASDLQQFKIQRSWLQIEKENSMVSLEQICYEMHSTGLLGEKEMVMQLSQKAQSQMGDRLNSLIDQVWWNAEKKSQQHLYFLD